MVQILIGVLGLGFIFFLICLIKPLPPFKDRKQVFVTGWWSLFGGMMFTAIVAATDPSYIGQVAEEPKATKEPLTAQAQPKVLTRTNIRKRSSGREYAIHNDYRGVFLHLRQNLRRVT